MTSLPKSYRNVVGASVRTMSIFTPLRLWIRMAWDDSHPHNWAGHQINSFMAEVIVCMCMCVMGECLGWRQLAYISLTSKCLTVKRCMQARTHALAHFILHHIKLILLHFRIKFLSKKSNNLWMIHSAYLQHNEVFDLIIKSMFILQFNTTLVIDVIIDALMWWNSRLL